jgi:hypothetical protein
VQEQLERPGRVLEELKGKWGEMFAQQSAAMKELVHQSVAEAVAKRKEERDKKKNKSGD